jgi:hypothetical protein
MLKISHVDGTDRARKQETVFRETLRVDVQTSDISSMRNIGYIEDRNVFTLVTQHRRGFGGYAALLPTNQSAD